MADSWGRVFGTGQLAPLPPARGFGERRKLPHSLSAIFLYFEAYSAMLRPVYSWRCPSVWHQWKVGYANPGGPEITRGAGGYQL